MNKRHDRLGLSKMLALCFIAGTALGCAFASSLDSTADSQLLSYLTGYFSLLKSGINNTPSFWATIWEILRWPLFSGLLGSTLLGLFISPLLLSLRGLFLSFTVSIFIRFFGLGGLLFSFSALGVPALCSVLSLFTISLDVITYHRSKKAGIAIPKSILYHFAIVFLLLVTGTLLHRWLSPILLKFCSNLLI